MKELESRCGSLDAQVADLTSANVELSSRLAAQTGAAQEAHSDAASLQVRRPSPHEEMTMTEKCN